MKLKPELFILLFALSCKPAVENNPSLKEGIRGNWQLLSSESLKSGKTIVNVTKGQKMIKIITDNYFAFLLHDLKDEDTLTKSIPVFSAGGGKYTLTANKYTEYLEYCSARDYEGNEFVFDVVLKGDTLLLSGEEKLKDIGVGNENVKLVEKYIRIKS